MRSGLCAALSLPMLYGFNGVDGRAHCRLRHRMMPTGAPVLGVYQCKCWSRCSDEATVSECLLFLLGRTDRKYIILAPSHISKNTSSASGFLTLFCCFSPEEEVTADVHACE